MISKCLRPPQLPSTKEICSAKQSQDGSQGMEHFGTFEVMKCLAFRAFFPFGLILISRLGISCFLSRPQISILAKAIMFDNVQAQNSVPRRHNVSLLRMSVPAALFEYLSMSFLFPIPHSATLSHFSSTSCI
jgi:hypothetical protein